MVKNSDMFRILWDPFSGNIKTRFTEITLDVFVCVVGVWQREICPNVQISRCQTPTTHTKTSKVISVKQV